MRPEMAKQHGSTVVAIYELADYVAEQGVTQTVGMNLGGTVKLSDEINATMVDAKHSSAAAGRQGHTLCRRGSGFRADGDWGPAIYCAGDTAVFGDMSLIRELYEPSIAILPIGGPLHDGPESRRRWQRSCWHPR